jgi:hypothetical protein
MFNYASAIFFGVTIGVASLIPLQAATNHAARNQCADQPLTHMLVHVRGFAGDSYYCVANKYL